MIKEYYTIGRQSECEVIINRSRFIGQAFPIQSEEEAIKNIEDLREQHPDATHHCYAYVIGRGSSVQRFNDDGEPGGTAGMPILQVIQQQEIQGVLVVVIRYFGGIKLGAGGLVRAYSKTAAEVLEKAGRKRMVPCCKGKVTIDYSLLGTLEHFLKQERIPIVEKEYKEKVTLTVITNMEWNSYCSRLTELCNGRVECGNYEWIHYPWDERTN